MEILLFFVFAILFAMGFNALMPRANAFVAGRPGLAKYGSSYAGQTAVTAILVFGLLLAVGLVFSVAKKNPTVAGVTV
jgi:hypothetical protein